MSDKNIKNEKMEAIVSLAKRRGFIYQGSEVYGGLSGTWDYGPLGVTLKRNIMQLWWKMFVDDREDMYGVDAAILMNQKVWQASGHVDTFTDPLVDCSVCGKRYRSDHLVKPHQDKFDKLIAEIEAELLADREALQEQLASEINTNKQLKSLNEGDLSDFIDNNKLNEHFLAQLVKISKFESLSLAFISRSKEMELAKRHQGAAVEHFLNAFVTCENCGSMAWGAAREFNMMFKTNVGPVDDESSISYLRPETAQGIFTNYKNVVDSFYPDLPFGLAQQGKAFRNEISPRDFIFRSREFEQMEIEYFIDPANWEAEFEKWVTRIHEWTHALGLPASSIHEVEVGEIDRAHYSKRTVDFEFDFPIGSEELLGLAYRGSFDLDNIERVAGKNMKYTVKGTNNAFVPHVIEPSFGVERALMAVLSSAYTEDEVNGEKRVYLKLPEHLAPIQYAVSPLLKNKEELVKKAREVYDALKKKYGNVMWDDNGNIGKRYRRQDEIGTPHCVVIDFDTLQDGTVTVRDRDTTEQRRVSIEELCQ